MTYDDDLAGTLHRLLGPPGAQVGCGECFERLDRYVELGLSGVDVARLMPAVANHLQDCLGCMEGYEGLRALVEAELASRPGDPPRAAAGTRRRARHRHLKL